MKNLAKFAVIAIFALFLAAVFLKSSPFESGSSVYAQAKPTPPAGTAPLAATAGDQTIPKQFILDKDAADPKGGPVTFNHDSHAFQNYSVDGKSPIACVECHHTDQPKSALKPPLLTSERDQTLTLAYWQTANIKVTHCRDCHFQSGNVPEGKQQPKATYTEGGKSTTKTLDNQ